jgi:DNA-binding response OmpR family regulator
MMKKYSVALIEDHPETLALLSYHLESENYAVSRFESASTAAAWITPNNTDLVLTDWTMPGISGFDLLLQLKSNPMTRHLPVLMLSGRNSETDIVTALEAGVEDYLIKPLRIRELLIRLKKVLNRNEAGLKQNVLVIGRLNIDQLGFKVFLSGELLHLTISEYKLLEVLATQPGKVLTRHNLLESINGAHYTTSERSVDVQITSLRKKLGDCKNIIETVRAVGYRFNEALVRCCHT